MSSGTQTVARSRARSGPRTVPRRRPKLTGRAAGLLAVVLVLAMTLVVPLRQYADQRARVAELEAKVESLSSANASLEKRIEQLRDPAYLERLARECLGMVKRGEIAFITVPRGGSRSAPAPAC